MCVLSSPVREATDDVLKPLLELMEKCSCFEVPGWHMGLWNIRGVFHAFGYRCCDYC